MECTTINSILASALLAVAGTMQAVDVKQGAALQSSGALLLDEREADEYAQGHAPGSILIPLGPRSIATAPARNRALQGQAGSTDLSRAYPVVTQTHYR